MLSSAPGGDGQKAFVQGEVQRIQGHEGGAVPRCESGALLHIEFPELAVIAVDEGDIHRAVLQRLCGARGGNALKLAHGQTAVVAPAELIDHVGEGGAVGIVLVGVGGHGPVEVAAQQGHAHGQQKKEAGQTNCQRGAEARLALVEFHGCRSSPLDGPIPQGLGSTVMLGIRLEATYS